jgi:glutathione-specific gamma-glutamylcyclotransferase
MLGLDQGGCCRGVGLCIPAAEAGRELPLVWAREMATGVYIARWVSIDVGGRSVQAIAFTANRDHPRYAGSVPDDRAAALIAAATGQFGSCTDYLLNTADHLKALDLSDSYIEGLAARHGIPRL